MYRIAVRGSKELTNKRTVLSLNSSRSLSKFQPPREAGFGKLLVVLSPVLVTGGVVTYAKYDDGFRKTLVQSVPAIEPALNYLLKEDLTKDLGSAKDTVLGFFGNSNDTPKKVDDVPPPLAKKKFDVKPDPVPASKPAAATSNVAVPMPEGPSAPAAAVKKDAPAKVEPQKAAPAKVESKPAAKSSAVPVPAPVPAAVATAAAASLDLSNLDGEIQVALKGAITEYQKAVRVLSSYNADVKKIVDGSIEKVEEIPWNQLKNRTHARNNAVQSAESTAEQAAGALARIEKAWAEKQAKSPEGSDAIKQHLLEARNKLAAAKTDLFKAKELSDMSERYWRKVEDARGFFVSEMESLFPDVNVTDKKLKLSKEELDLFTLYAYSHVLAYQKELQKLQVEGEARLKRALDQLRSEDLPNIEDQLHYYLEREKREMSVDNQKKLLQMRHEGEQRIRETLRKQAEAHVDHLNEALKLKESEMRRLFERELDDRVMKEKTSYKSQLAAYLGKLRGMEDALKEIEEEMKARSDADKSAHQSQALWAACQSLWSGVKNGVPGKTWRENLRPLQSEIKAVAKASEGDEFVKTVLDAIPPVAMQRGVFPEEALRERFVKVDQLARRLALVKDDKAKMPMFVLSYLQSMFILTPANAISKEELKDEIVDFGKLDTYDIMNRARYWMERGNLTQTVKYMNLLRGAPRQMAQDWINEARLLLETQQIVNTLMAHAASSGLLYL